MVDKDTAMQNLRSFQIKRINSKESSWFRRKCTLIQYKKNSRLMENKVRFYYWQIHDIGTYIEPGGYTQHLDVSHTVQRDTGVIRIIKPTICTYKT